MNELHRTSIIAHILHFIRRYFLWVVIIVAVILLAFAFEAGRVTVYNAHPELAQAEQATTVLNKVGQLIQLPTGETPSMATINDAASAKKAQPFLVNAQNGDVLIVYPNAGTALLYRPSTDKLIAVGPVNTGAENQQPQQIQPPLPEPIVATSTPHATSTKTKK
jgi:hypothetical protein